MGVCINYRLSQKKVNIKSMLDIAEQAAKFIQENRAKETGLSFEIRRPSFNELMIDAEGCETMRFEFQSPKYWERINAGGGYCYEQRVLTGDGQIKLDEGYRIADYPQNEIWYAAGFCKTQFSVKPIEHKWLADLLKVIAGRCEMAIVHDEGEYYHSGVLEDAGHAIAENGKVINGVVETLEGMGYQSKKSIGKKSI